MERPVLRIRSATPPPAPSGGLDSAPSPDYRTQPDYAWWYYAQSEKDVRLLPPIASTLHEAHELQQAKALAKSGYTPEEPAEPMSPPPPTVTPVSEKKHFSVNASPFIPSTYIAAPITPRETVSECSVFEPTPGGTPLKYSLDIDRSPTAPPSELRLEGEGMLYKDQYVPMYHEWQTPPMMPREPAVQPQPYPRQYHPHPHPHPHHQHHQHHHQQPQRPVYSTRPPPYQPEMSKAMLGTAPQPVMASGQAYVQTQPTPPQMNLVTRWRPSNSGPVQPRRLRREAFEDPEERRVADLSDKAADQVWKESGLSVIVPVARAASA